MTTTVRFVQGAEFASELIVLQEKTAMPFTPSHVEILSKDGKSYFGSMLDGGVQYRPVGYDNGKLAIDPNTHKARELLLQLPTTPEQENASWAWADKHIGELYDSPAIFGFVIPIHEHKVDHVICSACVTLFLRVEPPSPAKAFFPYPLAAPAHLIDPRDLLLGFSMTVRVPM